ncbi:UvrD-helicase domain-containing protein [Aliiglaciecola sp.]|nr:UvrD-helicase domain-containing protein [Aliiglaciecola sp.]
MASQKIDIDSISVESKAVVKLARQGANFLLSGGAGSGKTYSLVEVLGVVLADYPTLSVACITYTNAAVDEIERRIHGDNLSISTIHDFLWSNIKHYQNELKETLVELINDEEQTKLKSVDGKQINEDYFNNCEKIRYKEYLKLAEGIISHDEVIVVAAKMYEKYEKLCDITKDKYPFIFVDEYQDTDPLVVDIFLESFEKSNKRCVIGFFGDSMQSIYENSVGDLGKYLETEPLKVHEVLKRQNRRNPLNVIDLANKLRNDNLEQQPSDDISAPNMDPTGRVKLGEAKFLYSRNADLISTRSYLNWDFSDTNTVKELNLTHNLIASKANFPELMRVYDGDKIREYVKNKIRKPLKNEQPEFDCEGLTLDQVIRHLGNPAATPMQRKYIEKYPRYFELAKSLPYKSIADNYVEKEQLLDDKKNVAGADDKPSSNRDDLIKHLFKIEHLIRLYAKKQFNQFIQLTDFSVSSVERKQELYNAISSFSIDETTTIGEAIVIANELGLVIKDEKLQRFSDRNPYLFQQVCDIPYAEVTNLFDYLEGYSPFSTQHKTKGAEFPNVLVVLDNGRWNSYNFEYLFEQMGNQSVIARSEKLFYVCCTRAMEKLAVFFPNPSDKALVTAKSWFGPDNVINLD